MEYVHCMSHAVPQLHLGADFIYCKWSKEKEVPLKEKKKYF